MALHAYRHRTELQKDRWFQRLSSDQSLQVQYLLVYLHIHNSPTFFTILSWMFSVLRYSEIKHWLRCYKCWVPSIITCQDDISSEKGHYRTYVADEIWDLVDHVLCPTFLSYLIINLSQRLESYKKGLNITS